MFIKGNNTGNNTNPLNGDGKNHKSIKNSKNKNMNSKDESITSTIGDLISNDLSEDLSAPNSYELLKKIRIKLKQQYIYSNNINYNCYFIINDRIF